MRSWLVGVVGHLWVTKVGVCMFVKVRKEVPEAVKDISMLTNRQTAWVTALLYGVK